MPPLPQPDQAAFVGVRSTFYRIAMIAGQGGLVFLAGKISEQTGNVSLAWSIIFFILAGMFFLLFIYHRFVLPVPTSDQPLLRDGETDVVAGFVSTFTAFFKRPDIFIILAFLLLFRFGEAQALKLAAPFLLDPAGKGGLGLSTSQVGLVYGTIGVIALTIGGLLGGYAISRHGLKRWIWPMLLSVHLPNLAFVFLAYVLPDNIFVIATAIAIEQFGYGFGFAAYLLFMAEPGVSVAYLVGVLLILYAGFSMLVLAHSAWAVALVPEYHQRSRI